MLEKLDPAEMARLEEYFKAKGGVGGPSTSAPGPPPPPAPAPSSMVQKSCTFYSQNFSSDLQAPQHTQNQHERIYSTSSLLKNH